MSILSPMTGYSGFRTIDDASGMEVKFVTWVDDENLEYETVQYSGFLGMVRNIVKVTRVEVNYASREIHVNEPALVSIQIATITAEREHGACDECCDSDRCRRIGQCMRYRCLFGEASPP